MAPDVISQGSTDRYNASVLLDNVLERSLAMKPAIEWSGGTSHTASPSGESASQCVRSPSWGSGVRTGCYVSCGS